MAPSRRRRSRAPSLNVIGIDPVKRALLGGGGERGARRAADGGDDADRAQPARDGAADAGAPGQRVIGWAATGVMIAASALFFAFQL
jgi:hypothetical protein